MCSFHTDNSLNDGILNVYVTLGTLTGLFIEVLKITDIFLPC